VMIMCYVNLSVKLTLFVRVAATGKVHQGIRPKCQATKLLDPDPHRPGLWGLYSSWGDAKEYLDKRRAETSTELQHAIDWIWQRIVA